MEVWMICPPYQDIKQEGTNMEETIQFKLNGRAVSLSVDGERMLLWVLRTELGLTGTKYGCGQNQCGTCTVIVNKEAVRSCQLPIRNIKGKTVITIEGLAQNGKLHPLQKAFLEHGAFQCGYCTSGMIMNAYGLLMKNAQPKANEIVDGMEGNLCRCGTHNRVIRAIQAAAAEMRGARRK
jgi:aerobic-type carbon monoxide dehydrogenase small subunit (CoxS/CutS family)